MKGAGGTPGGVGLFLCGAALVVAGGYLLLTLVTVASGGWTLWGYNAFGLSLLPLLVGTCATLLTIFIAFRSSAPLRRSAR